MFLKTLGKNYSVHYNGSYLISTALLQFDLSLVKERERQEILLSLYINRKTIITI